MGAKKGKCRRTRALISVALVALTCGLSYAEAQEVRGEPPASFSAAKTSKEEMLLAEHIGNHYVNLGEPNSLPAVDSNDIAQYIDKQIALLAAPNIRERSTANEQIQRLWRLSVPQLVERLGDPNSMVNDAVMKNLILMRNESVIKRIINRINSSPDMQVKQSGVFVLGMMMEKRTSVISGRQVLDEASSAALVDNLIKPFLSDLEGKTTDDNMKKVIGNSRQFLARPTYRSSKPQQVE